MEVLLLKSPAGSLVPMGEEESEALKRIKSGSVVRCQISEMRNGKFFRKYWALLKMAFEQASERMQPREHKGVPVLPCFEEFRHDLIILAGKLLNPHVSNLYQAASSFPSNFRC